MLHVVPDSALPCSLPPIPVSHAPKDQSGTGREFVAPRTVLFHEGLPSAPQYRLSQGCIALSQTLADGRRQIIDIVGPGSLVGVSLGERNRVTAETLSYCQIEPNRADALGEVFSAMGEAMVRIEAHTTLLGRKTAPERVASAILDLSERFARPQRVRGEGRVFNLYPGRGDLADWLGLSLETVSRCFTRFRRAGLIDFADPEIVNLIDVATLQDIAKGNASA